MHPGTEPLLALLAGVALLLAGRRLFWLFVGAVGFFAGLRLSFYIVHPGAQGMRWLIALAAGLLGVVLAFALQRAAVALAGFVVGVSAAAWLLGINLSHLWSHSGTSSGDVLLCLAAGVVAAFLALWAFEGALIVLSAFLGAELIVDGFHLGRGLSGGAILLVLAVVGIAVQAGITARGAGRREARGR
ncbi:MAG TPA: DUF4203 domain-containing protein [Thermoanaerobaculia bacterium]|jgi:hypothetical protein